MIRLRNAFAKGFVTTQSGGGEKPHLRVTFPDIASVQEAHAALLEECGTFDLDTAAVEAILNASDEDILAQAQPGDVERVQEAFERAKAQATVLRREKDDALELFEAHDELLHRALDDRNYYRARAFDVERERDEATHALEFVEKHLTARLLAAEEAMRHAREALRISYNVTTYPGDGTSAQDKAIAAIDAVLPASPVHPQGS